VDIEQFYDANLARRASEELEFGRDWRDDEGNRVEISWVHDTGELYAMTSPVEPIVVDPLGDEFVQHLPTREIGVEVLAVLSTRNAVETTLAGWTEAMPRPDGLAWLHQRLAEDRAGHPAATPASARRDDPDTVAVRGAGTSGKSVMIATLIDRLNRALPAAERPRLDPYREQASGAGSQPTAEWHRAYRCARWAVQVASQSADTRLRADARRAFEVVREVKASVGAEILDLERLPAGHAVSPRFEVELAWVEEAAQVAEHAAARDGWTSVPWEPLLRDLLAT